MTRKIYIKTVTVESQEELQEELRKIDTGTNKFIQYICKEGDARTGRRYQITYSKTT